MDHAQGRAFHHDPARAIMHWNYLAGLLPFFEPALEWDDPSTEHHPRSGGSNPASRTLHTFVPLPVAPTSPSMVSHGSIPTHMVMNPEPHLRPLTMYTSGRESNAENAHHPREEDHPSTPVPANPKLGRPVPEFPRATTRTIPVPARSKQRSHPVDDPQPKKNQRVTLTAPESTTRPPTLPIITDVPSNNLNSEDSDEDAASKAPSTHETAAVDTGPTRPTNPHPTPPPGTSTSIEPTPTTTTIRILQPADSARDPGSIPYRPWTDMEDQDLINLKNGTKSRPSWKSIGARLRRDPQVCKLRRGILKQMSDQHGLAPPHEPEAED